MDFSSLPPYPRSPGDDEVSWNGADDWREISGPIAIATIRLTLLWLSFLFGYFPFGAILNWIWITFLMVS